MLELANTIPSRSEDQRLEDLLARTRPRRIVVITGAGISAESGIPTYRGEDGYWTETSANYRPKEVGYLSTFIERPREVWQYTLRHRSTCLGAEPNPAHRALAQLEHHYEDGFLLVTQNVDGLHLRAGNSPGRTIEAHGSLHQMRGLEGEARLHPIPAEVECPAPDQAISDASWALLRTPDGRLARPHSMFFDEAYDETLYRSQTAFDAARACDLLIVIGTSGATAMPWHLAVAALEADAVILTIDPKETPFGVHARNRERAGKGLWLRGTGGEWTPRVVERLLELRTASSPTQLASPAAKARAQRPIPRASVRLDPRASRDAPEYEASLALAELLADRQPRRVVISTGAGISAESGIPTFRGPGGYWVVGAHAERPTTREGFEADPRASWAFHLHRRGVCNDAAPNPAHLALAQLEQAIGDGCRVITQNVDGLHRRAGNSAARTYELHGNCNLMRALDGDPHPIAIPNGLAPIAIDGTLGDESFAALVMPDGRPARPHVLWWDEAYNEVQYRSESALAAGAGCDLLVTIGTSGAAALPYAIAAQAVLEADATLIDINPDDNPYAEHARERAEHGKGLSLRGPASHWVPELVAQLLSLQA